MRCHGCDADVAAATDLYTLKMELFAAAGPVEFSEAEMDEDSGGELDKIMAAMENMTDAEVAEEEKRIHMCRSFTLCRACRDRIAAQLDRLGPASS